MSVTVHVSASLARHTRGERDIEAHGACVSDVLDDLDHIYPGVRQALCDQRGRLLRFVAVFVNGVDIRALNGLESPVAPDAEIDILSAIAGG